MALTVRWKVPHEVLANPQLTYTVNVYESTSGENGQYQIINVLTTSGGNALNSYTDPGGSAFNGANYYYVTYTPPGGSEGTPVIAFGDPLITELRIAQQIRGKLPEIILARVDGESLIEVRKSMRNALDAINAYSPSTDWGYTNLPGRLEPAIILMAMTFLYIEFQLQTAIRDFGYGGTGINLQVDRNSKFVSTIDELNKALNSLMAFVKQPDWPDGVGLGTDAVSTPSARIFSFLFGTGSGPG